MPSISTEWDGGSDENINLNQAAVILTHEDCHSRALVMTAPSNGIAVVSNQYSYEIATFCAGSALAAMPPPDKASTASNSSGCSPATGLIWVKTRKPQPGRSPHPVSGARSSSMANKDTALRTAFPRKPVVNRAAFAVLPRIGGSYFPEQKSG